MSDDEKMPLTQHLEELRSRLLYSILAVGVCFIICYIFKEPLFAILMQPWIDSMPPGVSVKLIYTAPHEAFFTYMKVSLIGGTIMAIPVILWQIWKFIAPGLYQNEKRYMLPVIFFTSFCFVGGALFGYFVVFPAGFKFFASFASDYITPMVTTREYLTFTNRILLGFGFVFELPVFAFFLAKLGIIDAQFLKRKRKIATVLAFVVAAVLSPSPDVMSQFLMAAPLLVLYEVSIWVVYFFGAKPFKADDTDEQENTAA